MKAVQFDRFGEPTDVLRVDDVAIPTLERGEVRVRILGSPINPSDLMMVRGLYSKIPELPATPGFEGVGVVESGATGFLGKYLAGKRVAVLNAKTGSWGELAVVSARQAIPLASDIPFEQAAMFFVNPATAYVMTRRVLLVPTGAWLLQTAAGSALGRMIIRLGRRFGFRTLNVIRRDQQVDELKAIGGDEVICFDSERHDANTLRESVMRITNNKGVRFAIDAVGGTTGSAAIGCLAIGGRMLVYGTLAGDPLSFPPRELMTPGASIQGFWLARWMAEQGLLSKLRLVKAITGLMRQGVLVSEVGETYALAEIRDAVHKAEEVGRGGKVLLRIAEA